MSNSTFDPERLDVYRLSFDYVAFSYQIARSLNGANRQAQEWAAMHNVLQVCEAIDDDSNFRGKSDLKRNVSILIRLIHEK